VQMFRYVTQDEARKEFDRREAEKKAKTATGKTEPAAPVTQQKAEAVKDSAAK
jgi:hypothetical protein